MLEDRLSAALNKREAAKRLRKLTSPDPNLSDFSSNDYLSFSKSSALRKTYKNALAQATFYPYGPASSRLLDGTTPEHLALELKLSHIFESSAALLFNSGFDANQSIFSVLPGEVDAIIYDELIHASVHDGMRASRCKRRLPFKHNSAADLASVLRGLRRSTETTNPDTIFVAVETLYSMDGDLCPINDVLQIVQQFERVYLIVDEAHSTAVYGPRGKGLLAHLGVQHHPRILIRLHTFGKAVACSGAVVLSTPLIKSYLINYSRAFIYSTAMPQINVLAISTSIDHMQTAEVEAKRQHLHNLAAYTIQKCQRLFPRGSAALPDTLANSTATLHSPIIPILSSQPHALSAFLRIRGFLARPIAYPTVAKGQERIRICLHADNSQAEVDRLLDRISEWCDGSERQAKL